MADVNEWLDQHADRMAARQRTQVETAKLLATVAVGASATLVATALQVPGSSSPERWSQYMLLLAGLLTIISVLCDRLKEPDPYYVGARASFQDLTLDQKLQSLRDARDTAVHFNQWVVHLVQIVVALQLTAAGTAAILAAVSVQ